jgi:hypothetical protein
MITDAQLRAARAWIDQRELAQLTLQDKVITASEHFADEKALSLPAANVSHGRRGSGRERRRNFRSFSSARAGLE